MSILKNLKLFASSTFRLSHKDVSVVVVAATIVEIFAKGKVGEFIPQTEYDLNFLRLIVAGQ